MQNGTYLERILQNKIQTNEQTKEHSELRIRTLEIPSYQLAVWFYASPFLSLCPGFFYGNQAFLGLKLGDSKLCKRGKRKLLPEVWKGLRIDTHGESRSPSEAQRWLSLFRAQFCLPTSANWALLKPGLVCNL